MVAEWPLPARRPAKTGCGRRFGYPVFTRSWSPAARGISQKCPIYLALPRGLEPLFSP